MNTLSGNGLTIGQSLTPKYQMTIRQGDGGSPYTAPPKEKTGPFVPAPKRELASLADGEPDASIMLGPTEKGFFYDGQGRSYMQTGGKFYDAGEYDVDIHGLPVPLARQMQINPDLAAMYSGDDVGSGVIIPQDFSPPPFRYFPHYRTPAIKQQELDHFNNFIESMGGGLDRVQNPNAMMISQAGVGAPHSNVKIYEDTDYYGNPYKRVLPNFGGTYIGNVRPKKT